VITLRAAIPADIDAIASLLAEVDRFYGAPDLESADERIPVIRDAILGTLPAAHVLLAWRGAELVGFASYSFLWPAAGVTRSLWLKELYVKDDRRREGVGRLLMQQLCKVATEAACSRLEWTTDVDNSIAQGFYAALGVSHNPSKLFYRLDRDALENLATPPLEHRGG
jgi:GNAT superfamily N-acetyltransferase